MTCILGDGVVVKNSANNNIMGSAVRAQVNGADLEMFFFGISSGVLVGKAGQKIVLRAKFSSGAGFGDSKLYVDDVEVVSTPSYVASVPASGTLYFNTSVNHTPMRLYGLTGAREGILTAPQQASVYQWHKDIAGIA